MTEPMLPPPGDARSLWVLDLSGYVFRAYHALPSLTTSDGRPVHVVHGLAQMLHKLVERHRPLRLVAAMDTAGPSFRKEIYPDYKANRPPPPEDLLAQFEEVERLVDAFRIPRVGVPGFEADDVVATLVERARAEGLSVVVLSADKDLLQLVGPDVLVYDSMRGRLSGPGEVEARYGVPPARLRDLLALMGDGSDNVPGVPSVGVKTAAKLLRRFGSLEALYRHLQEVKRPALRRRLEEYEAQARLSQQLVTLRSDVPIDVDPAALSWQGPDPTALRALYERLQMRSLLRRLPKEEPDAPRKASSRQASLPGVGDVVVERWSVQDVPERLETLRGPVACVPALDGADPLRARLLGVAFSDGRRCGFVSASAATLWRALAEEHRDVEFVTAGLKALLHALAGDTTPSVELDVTLADYLLDPDRSGHDVEALARRRLGEELPPWPHTPRKGEQASLAVGEDASADDYAEPTGRRAVAAARLAPELREALRREGLREVLEELELPLAGVLARMERWGIRLDIERLEAIEEEIRGRMEALERRAHELAGQPFNVRSPRQLERILFDELGLPVLKKTKTARSTDHEVLEELSRHHELPAVVLEHRRLAKLDGTYLQALPRQVDPHDGRIHTRFHQDVAATGRLSSSDPNLQNIPVRSEWGQRIREAFVPREGWGLLSADYSQIELRILAHLSEDPLLCEAFREGRDVHRLTASALFGVPPDAVSKEQRGAAKTVNYAVIYGQTDFALARNLRISRAEAKRYIEAFFTRYEGVARLLDALVEEGRRSGVVRTMSGRLRRVGDLRSRDARRRQAAERVARNTPIQGSAADLLKRAMIDVDRAIRREGLQARMLLTVHDELLFEAPPEEREPLQRLVRERMEGAAALRVPLVVDMGWGDSWGAAK